MASYPSHFITHLLLLLQVRVINKSDKKQRIHVLPAQTPSFKFDVTNNGFIRPGLAQDIKITFRPTEYRYYYDCVRLHCPGQNILVSVNASYTFCHVCVHCATRCLYTHTLSSQR